MYPITISPCGSSYQHAIFFSIDVASNPCYPLWPFPQQKVLQLASIKEYGKQRCWLFHYCCDIKTLCVCIQKSVIVVVVVYFSPLAIL